MPVLSCTAIGRKHARRAPAGRARSAAAQPDRIVLTVFSALIACLLGAPALAEEEAPSSTVTVEQTTTVPGQDPTTTTTTTTTTTEPPSPSAGTTSLGVGESVCGEARALLRTGRPEDALALIDAARATSPGADAETKAEAAVLCPKTRADAIEDIAAGPAGRAGDIGRGWAVFVRAWVEPLLPSVLIGLGWLLLGFFVAVRVLSTFPQLSSRPRSATLQAGWAWSSAASSALAIVALGAALAEEGQQQPDRETAFVLASLGALLLAVSAITAAMHVTGRLRIAVTVQDKVGTSDSSAARTTQLIALLGRVGASPPAGVEAPLGSDVTSLSGSSLFPIPANAIAKAVVAVLAALVSGSPWRVTLHYSAEDAAAIVVSRNGRTVATAELTASSGAPDPGLFETAEMKRTALTAQAAGVVIVALSRAHLDFEGLGGATDGRSVGLQYLATTTFAHDHERAALLLGRALELDPGNRAADVSLQHLLHRHDRDASALRSYRNSLAERADELAKDEAFRLLEQRVLMTYFVVLINLRAADPDAGPPGHLRRRFRRMETLLSRSAIIDRTSEQDPLRIATRERFDGLRRALLAEYRLREQDLPLTEQADASRWNSLDPYRAYNASLSHLAQGRSAAAAFSMDAASVDHDLRRWRRRDPELTRLRGTEEVERLVGRDPSAGLWDLPLFGPRRFTLQNQGFLTPLALAACTPSAALAEDLGMSETLLARLVSASGLLEKVMSADMSAEPLAGLEPWRIDLAEILLEAGASLEEAPSVGSIAAELSRRRPATMPVSEASIDAWLRKLAPAPSSTSSGSKKRLRLSIDLRRR